MANDRTGRAPRLRRDSDEVKAVRAETLLHNPDLRAVFDTVRDEIIADIERATLDGSQEKNAEALEHIRGLQALLRVKQVIMRPIVKERLSQGSSAK